MYTPAEILRGLRKPRRLLIELNRIYHEYVVQVDRVGVMDRDWDTLVILDGCRYDVFERANTISGSLESVISRGSSTGEFLHGNFSGEMYPDTVYVSANPQLALHGMCGRFHACKRLWEGGWDAEHQTVLPETVTDSAIEAYREYPNKQLIIHYVQPHFPFIGKRGQEIAHSGFAKTPGQLEKMEFPTVWERLERGDLNVEEVWGAYRENLDLVLPEVERLLDAIPGEAIITSDHGNSFGELGVYGHPGNHFLESLIKVPWLVVPGESRRNIEAGEISDSSNQVSDSVIMERLSDLGYRV